MRLRIASLLAVAALGFGAAGSAQARPAAALTPAAATCSAGYVSARLPWGHKCLRAGEFCKVGNRAYRRYGVVCPQSGHLRRRS
ncbi:MAG TPA: hypothetical protein VE985_09190 [Gaiellaceae bacterium]|nr:hypothetical protein [Gaiellaceae bacterium]